MFEPLTRLLLGLLAGVLFGVLLQKSGVSRFATIVDQLRLRDFTMMKVMLTAIVVGGLGTWVLHAAGLAELHIKPALLGAVIVGGTLFGAGMAVLGYCPGTGVAAVAEGSRHAIAGVAGMLAGAFAYTESYAWLAGGLLRVGDRGKLTLPDLTGVPAIAWLAILAAAWLILFLAWRQPAAPLPDAPRGRS